MREFSKKERQFLIITELFKRQGVTVGGLAKTCRVSEKLIERDLRDLEKTTPGLFKRFYGGAELLHREWPYGRSAFHLTMRENCREKQVIAAYVVKKCIPNNAFLGIDVGTTSTIFARELAKSSLRGLRVATHSASVPIELLDGEGKISRLRVMGGETLFREAGFLPANGMGPDWYPFGGAGYIAVMSTESFSVANGAATTEQRISELDQVYIANARSVIMLMDHSKFCRGANHTITMCGLKPEKTDWLHEKKPFKLVTDANWEKGDPPEEFEKLAERIKPEVPRDKEFSSIRVFKCTLEPKPEIMGR